MSLASFRPDPGRGAHAAIRSAAIRSLTSLAVATGAVAGRLPAQVGHQHHDSTSRTAPAPADGSRQRAAAVSGDSMAAAGRAATPERPFGIPMTRMGSGTAWLPDASAMRAWHFTAGSWMLMVHGDAFLQYDHQGGLAGRRPAREHQLGHADGDAAGGRRHAPSPRHGERRAADDRRPRAIRCCCRAARPTEASRCTTGSIPHDLFMELSALYERAINRRLGVLVYAAPVGEPAIGPVAYMHRPSALNDPFAPLAHHWTDATHITYGVLTAGLFTKRGQARGHAVQRPGAGRGPLRLRFSTRSTRTALGCRSTRRRTGR